MSYTAKIEGFEQQNIEVEVGFWSGPKLLVNGQPVENGPKRGEMILQRNDGRRVIATWKPQFLGLDVPQLVVDGKAVTFVEPLKWYQWVWGGWPLILLFRGGALGGLAGAAAIAINAKIFREDMSDVLKYAMSGLVSLAAVIFYFLAAILVAFLLNR